MRVEAGQHAVDGILDQVLVADRVDVFGTHPLEHVAEQGQQAIRVGAAAVLGERGVDAEIVTQVAADQARGRADGDPGHEGGAEQQTGA